MTRPPWLRALYTGFASVTLWLSAAGTANTTSLPKKVMGVTEIVRIEPEGLMVVGRLDTGASMTSMDARNIRLETREGRTWVVFDYVGENSQPVRLERELVRTAVIRPAPDVRDRRPVVMLRLCIGNVVREVQVNLIDRTRMNSRILIGRNFLASGGILVDSALELSTSPDCKPQ